MQVGPEIAERYDSFKNCPGDASKRVKEWQGNGDSMPFRINWPLIDSDQYARLSDSFGAKMRARQRFVN
jgi:hypothetical protein